VGSREKHRWEGVTDFCYVLLISVLFLYVIVLLTSDFKRGALLIKPIVLAKYLSVKSNMLDAPSV